MEEKRHIIIAGAGPIGLYLAINLMYLHGHKVNVTVVDQFLEDYRRPGVIAKAVIDVINASLSKKGLPNISVPDAGCVPANAIFIRDLQVALLTLAKGLKVNIIAAPLQEISANSVLVGEVPLSCDLLLDCTGERRFSTRLIKEFKIEPIADNPIKNHFIAFITMNPQNAALSNFLDHPDPVIFTLSLEKLRRDFGWKEYSLPSVVKGMWNATAEKPARFYFYFEISDEVATKEINLQIQYLKTLLKLYTGNDLTFSLEEGERTFIPFQVTPKKSLTPVITQATTYPISLCGDALMSADYRLGTGVRNGILCANALITSISIPQNNISIDTALYDFQLRSIMGSHEQEVKGLYDHKRALMNGADLLRAKEIYRQALAKSETLGTENKNIIEAGCKDLALRLKAEGSSLFSQSKFKEALQLYQNSLDLLEHMTERDWEEISKLYSNIAKVFFNLKNYDAAIDMAGRGLIISNEHETSMQERFRDILDVITAVKVKYLLEYAKQKIKDQDIHAEVRQIDILLKNIRPSYSEFNNLKIEYDSLLQEKERLVKRI